MNEGGQTGLINTLWWKGKKKSLRFQVILVTVQLCRHCEGLIQSANACRFSFQTEPLYIPFFISSADFSEHNYNVSFWNCQRTIDLFFERSTKLTDKVNGSTWERADGGIITLACTAHNTAIWFGWLSTFLCHLWDFFHILHWLWSNIQCRIWIMPNTSSYCVDTCGFRDQVSFIYTWNISNLQRLTWLKNQTPDHGNVYDRFINFKALSVLLIGNG